MIPPECEMTDDAVGYIMRLNGYTKREELEPSAGCRRFRLS